MKLIELHVLQSFPVSCLNRDELGSPKAATFGGVNRARLASQCLKRATRKYAKDHFAVGFDANRTKELIPLLTTGLIKQGIVESEAAKHALKIGEAVVGLDSKDKTRISALMFIAPSEIESICVNVAKLIKEGTLTIKETATEKTEPKGKKEKKDNSYAKKIAQFCKEATLHDGADVAIFGRMVASTASLTLEGATLFGHAISTHKADNDLDFFSAVDDLKTSDDDAGSSMLGTTEFTSAVYYRYVALNLDLLKTNLAKIDKDQRKAIVNAFIRAVLQAIPSARKNSMNASTLPGFVLGIYKEGQPLQLVNAFENPVRSSGGGLLAGSVEAIKAHNTALKTTWDLTNIAEVSLPESNISEFCNRLIAYVE